MYDIIIIGAGVTGCAVARYLSRYEGRMLVLEKAEDVCCGTSKANSASRSLPDSICSRMERAGSEANSPEPPPLQKMQPP